jgi:hypothetical protein
MRTVRLTSEQPPKFVYQALNDAVSKGDAAQQQVAKDDDVLHRLEHEINAVGDELQVWTDRATELQTRADTLTRAFDE